jgi:hypothetical protein
MAAVVDRQHRPARDGRDHAGAGVAEAQVSNHPAAVGIDHHRRMRILARRLVEPYRQSPARSFDGKIVPAHAGFGLGGQQGDAARDRRPFLVDPARRPDKRLRRGMKQKLESRIERSAAAHHRRPAAERAQ